MVARLPYKLGYPIALRLDNRFVHNQDLSSAIKQGLKSFSNKTENPLNLDEVFKKYTSMHARERLDTYRLTHLRRKDFEDQVLLEGDDYAKQALSDGNGAILIMAHYGRPVMLCSALAQKGPSIGMLTGSVQDNPNLDKVDLWFHYFGMQNTLNHSKGSWFTTRDDLRGLYKALKKGEIIIVMMDLPAGANGINTPFFGGHLHLPQGIIRIAQKTQARLIYGSAKEIADGRVHAKIYPLDSNPEKAMMQAVKYLERDITEDCSQWWQWNLWPTLFIKDGNLEE